MSVVTRLRPVNPLAALIDKPGGLRVSEAVAAAEANLESVRDAALERLDAILAEMDACAAAVPGYAAATVDALYRLSNEIVGVAGVFGYPHMGEAAYSLCDLLDASRASETWRASAVGVHLRTLRLLRQQGGPAADPLACQAILEGLRQVAQQFRRP